MGRTNRLAVTDGFVMAVGQAGRPGSDTERGSMKVESLPDGEEEKGVDHHENEQID